MTHVPVLAGPLIEWLKVEAGGVYVDCTAGAGGHAERIAERLDASGLLLAIDRDPGAVQLATKRLEPFPQARVVHGNYAHLRRILTEQGIDRVDGIVIDAGISSMQLDDPARGFSFQEPGPLDMRMDPSEGMTASEYLGAVDVEELTRVLREYGDVRRSRAIAKAIKGRVEATSLDTTADLADAIAQASKPRAARYECRRAFQAIRIAVNQELANLKTALDEAIAALKPGGRLVAVSFHSGEDRIVKRALREASRSHIVRHPDGRTKTTEPPRMRLLTPGPVTPSKDEIEANPRSKSAKLRAAERLG